MTPLTGYCVLTNTISGQELVWRVEEMGITLPEVYETELEAEKAIVNEQIDICQEFLSGDRVFDEMVWVNEEYSVAYITIDEDGNMKIHDDSACILSDGKVIMEMTLKQWRDGL